MSFIFSEIVMRLSFWTIMWIRISFIELHFRYIFHSFTQYVRMCVFEWKPSSKFGLTSIKNSQWHQIKVPRICIAIGDRHLSCTLYSVHVPQILLHPHPLQHWLNLSSIMTFIMNMIILIFICHFENQRYNVSIHLSMEREDGHNNSKRNVMNINFAKVHKNGSLIR